jgi:hypothetical protein
MLKNFFGEEDLAVVGVGSTKKLGEFYGVPIKSLKRHPSAETLSPEKEEFPAEFKIEPHDVSVHQIQGTGLKSMIISVFPLFYFIAFLLQEQTVENCLFVLDVLELEKLEDAEWKSKAKELYHTYFTSQGMLELNLTHKSKAGVEEAIEMLDKQCLNQAFSEIMVLLEQSYSGFKKSDLFNRMAYDLGIFC